MTRWSSILHVAPEHSEGLVSRHLIHLHAKKVLGSLWCGQQPPMVVKVLMVFLKCVEKHRVTQNYPSLNG